MIVTSIREPKNVYVMHGICPTSLKLRGTHFASIYQRFTVYKLWPATRSSECIRGAKCGDAGFEPGPSLSRNNVYAHSRSFVFSFFLIRSTREKKVRLNMFGMLKPIVFRYLHPVLVPPTENHRIHPLSMPRRLRKRVFARSKKCSECAFCCVNECVDCFGLTDCFTRERSCSVRGC